MSQCSKILEYLQQGNSITPRQSQELFECDRLAARIRDLRNAGHEIETKAMTRNNKTFASYFMPEHIKIKRGCDV